MPVRFDPEPIPRFDQSLLSYLNKSFTKVAASIGALSQRGSIAPKYYTAQLSNGTATTFTVFNNANTNILTAQYPLTMNVEVDGWYGFGGATNDVRLWVRDEAGAEITHGPSAVFGEDGRRYTLNNAAKIPFSIRGKKDYNINQTCGFQLAYLVISNNVWLDCSVKVSFYPRG